MLRKTRIAILANFYATFCLLLFNSWLILHHGHQPQSYLRLDAGHPAAGSLIQSFHCHNASDSGPLFEDHSLQPVYFTQCLICISYQGIFSGTDNNCLAYPDQPDIFRASAPDAIHFASPAFSFQLRAPPFRT